MAQQNAADPALGEEVDDLIDELQPGAKLLKGQYTITRYLNSGGFGITYLAKDSLDRDVVIKECFPSSFCRRSKTVVAARSRAHTAELRSIVQLFVREARNLAKIVHPNIVAVHQVFEDNGTAYMAIDYINGLDLQQIIDGEGTPLTPEQIVYITDKLLVAVGYIHDSDMLHRDISPDNVLIDKSGEPILIDFGAAREHASKSTRAMSALRVVKDGYSPQEFYIAGSEQGPWSDLYALAATLYHLISGDAPVNGQARLAALAEDRPDPYVPLSGRFKGYPPGYLEAIDRAMNTLPKQRLQSAKEWRALFTGSYLPTDMAHAAQSAATGTDAAPDSVADAVHQLVKSLRGAEEAEATSAAAAAPAPADAALAKAASGESDPDTARRGLPVKLVAGVAGVVVLAAVGFAMMGGKDPAPPADKPAQAAMATGASDEAPAKPETAAAVTAEPEPAATKTAAAAATEPAPVAAEPSVDPAPPVEETATAEPEPAPATEDTATVEPEPAPATEDTATVEPEPAPAAETAPAETAAAEPDAAEPAAETAAATETAAPAEPEATPVASTVTGTPAANQLAFAAWDVKMPFLTADRIVGGKRTAVISRIPPNVDPAASGSWIVPGVQIHAVNTMPVVSANELTMTIMNAMAVDPDGKTRVIVDYTEPTGARKSDLLTVETIRLVSLANGVSLRIAVVDGTWKTEVTGVADPSITTLQPGDVLFRDKTTTVPLDKAGSIEGVMADLVSRGAAVTEFSIVRNNRVDTATMQLALEGGQ